MKRSTYLALAVALIGAGLLFRLGPWHLPLPVHHYGGGLLWGAMLYAVIAGLRPPGWGRAASLATTIAAIMAVEMSRLLHTPGLDAFRLTLAGQLLLGRIFAPLNMFADAVGAVLAAAAMPRSQPSLAPAASFCEDGA